MSLENNQPQAPVFERERKPFRMLGKQFHFEFIPSIHFQGAMQQVLEMLLHIEVTDSGNGIDFKEGADYSQLFKSLRSLLEEKVYQIVFDVLLYQNNERVEIDRLKYGTSPLEIAEFITLVMTDSEIKRSLEVVTSGLGKLIENLNPPTQSQTANSTQSS